MSQREKVYVPSHWRETLRKNPQAIVGMTKQPDDAEEWVALEVREARTTPPESESES